MSAIDHSPGYYQQLDITDPTPYEKDDGILDGEVCVFCGCGFHRGEGVMFFEHMSRRYSDRFYMHRDCMNRRFGALAETALDVLDEFGFAVLEEDTE